jgi:hypothetical protein
MFKKFVLVVVLVLFAIVSLTVNNVGLGAPGRLVAWECGSEGYQFQVSNSGAVQVRNLSDANEPAQHVIVKITNGAEATFDVPALNSGTDWVTIGHIELPSGQFEWSAKGDLDCEDRGTGHHGEDDEPDDPDNPPGGIICMTQDTGGIVEVTSLEMKDSEGNWLPYNGYAHINDARAFVLVAGPGAPNTGDIKANGFDANGNPISVEFHIENGIPLPCENINNWGCYRFVYVEGQVVDVPPPEDCELCNHSE